MTKTSALEGHETVNKSLTSWRGLSRPFHRRCSGVEGGEVSSCYHGNAAPQCHVFSGNKALNKALIKGSWCLRPHFLGKGTHNVKGG